MISTALEGCHYRIDSPYPHSQEEDGANINFSSVRFSGWSQGETEKEGVKRALSMSCSFPLRMINSLEGEASHGETMGMNHARVLYTPSLGRLKYLTSYTFILRHYAPHHCVQRMNPPPGVCIQLVGIHADGTDLIFNLVSKHMYTAGMVYFITGKFRAQWGRYVSTTQSRQ